MKWLVVLVILAVVAGFAVGFLQSSPARADPVQEQSNGQATAVCPLSKGWNLVAINKTQLNCGTVWIWVP
jgi:hypothetical protein